MVNWTDTAIHFGVATVFTFLGGFVAPWQWILGATVVALFWVREATQRFDRHGVDGDPAKALNPLRWGFGSQMELIAPAAGAVLTATAWSVFG